MQSNPPAHLAGKSTAYEYLKFATDAAWAWEFARRNALVQEAVRRSREATLETPAEGFRIVWVGDRSDAIVSPIVWASSTDDSATEATVGWDDRVVPNVLHAVSVPTRYGFGGAVLDLESIELDKTLVVAGKRPQTLILRDGQKSLQISIEGAPITEVVALFVDTKITRKNAVRQLRLLECFRAVRAFGELPDACFPPHPRSARNAFVLEALDGYLAGKSHHDIAVGLFGEARVDRDWSDPGENMRDTVRRAIARGVTTMERGYLEFFRSAKRSR